MDVVERVGHLEDIACGDRLGEIAFARHLVCQRSVLDILHAIIGRVVLLKHIDDAHDVLMAQFGDVASLLHKFLTIAQKGLPTPFCPDNDMVCLLVTLADFLHEKLLDRDFPFQPALYGKVGDAEATLPELLFYLVFPILKNGSLLKILHGYRLVMVISLYMYYSERARRKPM